MSLRSRVGLAKNPRGQRREGRRRSLPGSEKSLVHVKRDKRPAQKFFFFFVTRLTDKRGAKMLRAMPPT